MRFLLAAAVAAALALLCPHAAAKGSCLRYSQTNDTPSREMQLTIENACAADMTCTLSWRVTCVGVGGRTTSEHDETGLVGVGSSRTWTAAAEGCGPGDGYEISAPTWSCRP